MKTLRTFILLILSLFLILSLRWNAKGIENSADEKNNNTNKVESVKSSDITINISLDTNTYLQSQSVWLDVRFKNIGFKTDSLANLSEYGIFEAVQIKNETGEMLEYKGLEPSILKEYFVKLLPNEEQHFSVELKEVFGDVSLTRMRNTFSPRNEFSSGLYTLRLEMNTFEKSMIISNEVSFSVVEPPQEEKEYSGKLNEIYSLQDALAEEQRFKINSFIFFFNSANNDSKYFDEAFYTFVLMRYFTKVNINELLEQEILEYLENHINKHESKKLVWYYADASLKTSGNDVQVRQSLNLLKEKYPNTRLAEGVDFTLKSKILKKP